MFRRSSGMIERDDGSQRRARWLRDEWEIALNEVLGLCVEAADHYEDAARRLAGAGEAHAVAGLLDRTAERRRCQARRLETVLRAHDELPKDPDPDAELVHRATQWVKAIVATDEERALLEARLQQETRLAETVDAALTGDLPVDAARCLGDIARDVASQRARLTAMLQA
jgi:hypothetical protein